jgi:hypothetical protein
MAYDFRWNDWTIDHIVSHGVNLEEAEFAVEHPARGFPRYDGDGKYRPKLFTRRAHRLSGSPNPYPLSCNPPPAISARAKLHVLHLTLTPAPPPHSPLIKRLIPATGVDVGNAWGR